MDMDTRTYAFLPQEQTDGRAGQGGAGRGGAERSGGTKKRTNSMYVSDVLFTVLCELTYNPFKLERTGAYNPIDSRNWIVPAVFDTRQIKTTETEPGSLTHMCGRRPIK